MRRGQTGTEFIILFGFLLIVFMVFFVAMQNRVTDQQFFNREILYSALADKVEQELLLAAQVKPGYMRDFELPLTLDGEPYNVTIEDNTIVIKGNYSQNEFLRFLGFDVNFVPGGATSVLTGSSRLVIVERTATGVFIRKDCVSAGQTADTCT